jgi:preprotein translocase subunit YajC
MADEVPKIEPAAPVTAPAAQTAPVGTAAPTAPAITREIIGTAPTPPPAPPAPDMLSSLLWTMGPVILIFYFLVIRPDSKRRSEQASLLSTMKKGDKVLLTVGIYGTIGDIEGDDVTLIIDTKTNTKMKIRKDAVATILNAKE